MGEGLETERRAGWVPCPKHDMFEKQIERNFQSGEKRMDQLEKKIDALLAGQAQQALSIQDLHNAISNGLRGEIRRTKEATETIEEKVTTICVSYDEKFKELDDFKWFRTWANRLKDGAITKVLTITMLGGFMIGVLLVLLWFAQHIGLVKLGT